MAHIEHFKRADVARLCNEWEREKRADGEWKFHPTGEIDASRTAQNYTMEPGSVKEKLASRLADSGLKVDQRKHVNVLSDWAITCPEELRGDPAQERRFFEVTYAFLQDRYGAENVLQGHVHMDETSPHMHTAIVPVKDGRVSAKALFNKAELRSFHADLDAVCAVEFGRKGLVKNGRTKGGYTTAELKARTQAEQAQEQKAGELAGQQAAINQERQTVEAERAKLSHERSQWEVEREREQQQLARQRDTLIKARAAVEARERAVEAREAALPGLATQAAREAVKHEIEAARAAQRRPSEQRAAQDAISAALSAAGAVKAPGYQRGGKTL